MKSLNQPVNPFAAYQVTCFESAEPIETVIFSETRSELKKAKHFINMIAKANCNKAFMDFTWDDISPRGVFVWYNTETAAEAFLNAYGDNKRTGLSYKINTDGTTYYGVWISFSRLSLFC